jgi:hypothetical protein
LVEAQQRAAISIHFGEDGNSIVLVGDKIVLHNLGTAVFDLYSAAAVPDLVIDQIATIAKESSYSVRTTLRNDVVFD